MRLLKLMEFLFSLSTATSVRLVLHFGFSLTGVCRAWTLMCICWLRTVALNGICTQQHSSDGVFKNQCYSSSAFGIVGFHSAVVVKPGILADTGFVLFKHLSTVLLCWAGLVSVRADRWFSLVCSVCFFKQVPYGTEQSVGCVNGFLWKRKQPVGQVSTELSVQEVWGKLMEAWLLTHDSRRSKLQ